MNYVFGSGLYLTVSRLDMVLTVTRIFDTVGLLGIGLVLSALFYFDRSPFRIKAVAFIFLFSTFPIVTYAFFSFMLALILRPLEGEASNVVHK